MTQASQDSGFAWPPPADDLAAVEVVELRNCTWTVRLVAPLAPSCAGDRRLLPVTPERHRPSRLHLSCSLLAAGVLLGAMLPGTPDGRAPIVRVLRTLGVASSHDDHPRAPVAFTRSGQLAPPAVAPQAAVDAGLGRGQSGTAAAAALDPPWAVSRSVAVSLRGTTPGSGPGARRRPVSRRPPAERQVLDVMDQYQSAFSRMDIVRLQLLWPASDRHALTRTFGETSEHRLTLSRCAVDVGEVRATTRCLGVLRSRPRRSDQRTRVQRGEWTFELERDADRWAIASVVSR